jgi:hypothetical protein
MVLNGLHLDEKNVCYNYTFARELVRAPNDKKPLDFFTTWMNIIIILYFIDMYSIKDKTIEFTEAVDVSLLSANGIENIVFGEFFNQSVDNLVVGIKSIVFGHEFNQTVDKLPEGLETIEFGTLFNQPVDSLPASVKRIVFGGNFNQSVDKLPAGLLYVEFGYEFTQSIDNLPDSITHLIFRWGLFRRGISHFPENLTHLVFGEYYNEKVILQKRAVEVEQEEEVASVIYPFGPHIPRCACIKQDCLECVETIEFGNYFNQELKIIDCVKSVKFGDRFNQKLVNLPDCIEKIEFGKDFNQDIHDLPDSITDLVLPEDYSKEILRLPASLKRLCVYKNNYSYERFDIQKVLANKAIYPEKIPKPIDFRFQFGRFIQEAVSTPETAPASETAPAPESVPAPETAPAPE